MFKRVEKRLASRMITFNTTYLLEPFGLCAGDLIRTPMGTNAAVAGVYDGILYVIYPGGVTAPLSDDVRSKESMEAAGYFREPEWRQIKGRCDTGQTEPRASSSLARR